MNAAREAGFTDAQVLEIVVLAVQFALANLISNVSGTDIDFDMIITPLTMGGTRT